MNALHTTSTRPLIRLLGTALVALAAGPALGVAGPWLALATLAEHNRNVQQFQIRALWRQIDRMCGIER